MTAIKICGLRRREDVEIINRYQPDYVGFVFAPSARQVTPEQAAELGRYLAPEIQRVGVFVNAPPEEIRRICSQKIIDVIQLHGQESEEEIVWLKRQTGCPVIKAVAVQNTEQVRKAMDLPCDFLLLDTYSKKQAGGTGRGFDLNLIPAMEKPFFLAGGLGPDNVREKILACHPYGVDVSSGVEVQGWKDEIRIRDFVRNARMTGPVKE